MLLKSSNLFSLVPIQQVLWVTLYLDSWVYLSCLFFMSGQWSAESVTFEPTMSYGSLFALTTLEFIDLIYTSMLYVQTRHMLRVAPWKWSTGYQCPASGQTTYSSSPMTIPSTGTSPLMAVIAPACWLDARLSLEEAISLIRSSLAWMISSSLEISASRPFTRSPGVWPLNWRWKTTFITTMSLCKEKRQRERISTDWT